VRRTPLIRAQPEARTSVPILRPKKCKGCGERFRPMRPMQTACGVECARVVASQKLAKDQSKADKAKRESLKTRRDYLEEAQRAFNKFVRLRDAGRPCICCGRPLELGANGGGFDAGHYRSIGSAPHLRFEPDNCHAQSKQCNRWGSGRAVDYRLGLIGRIGLARVEALEANQETRKWSIAELKAIRDTYKAKAKELEK